MFFYISIFIVLCIFSFIEGQNLNKNINVFIYFLFCFCFYIFSFIRWETGTDWENYYYYYSNIRNILPENDNFEFGYSTIVKLISSFSDNYTLFLIVSGFLLFTFQTIAIKKMSPYPITSLLFLWAIQFANILFVRQWIAIAILVYSTIFIQKRKFFPFLFLVLLATSFHRSSILFFLGWWIYYLKLSKKKMIIILLISISFSIILIKIIDILSGGFGEIVMYKIDKYLSNEYNNEINQELGYVTIIIKGFANKLLILLASFYFYNRIVLKYPQFKGYLNLFWFGAVIYFSTISISIVFVRFSYVFDFFQIILVAYIFKIIKNNILKIFMYIIFFIYLFARMWLLLNGPYKEEFVPFKTFF